MTTIITILAVAAIIAMGFIMYKKRKSNEGREKDAAYRRFSSNKKLYNGIVLSDYMKNGKIALEDEGHIKGWVCGPNTAIVAKHVHPKKGNKIHSYDVDGNKVPRSITNVVKLDYDVAVVTVNETWPENVERFKLASFVADKYTVFHKDGVRSTREADHNTKNRAFLHSDFKSGNVDRLLIRGESGLPWFQGNEVVSHTYRVDHGVGPNYPVLRGKIIAAINRPIV